MKRLLLLFVVLSSACYAQVIPPGGIQIVASDPAGACTVGSTLQYNYTDGKLWGCESGTWTAITGSSGVTNFSVTAVPAWLTDSVATPTTTPALTLAANTGQSSHLVVGTCGSATTVALCSLVLGDLPSALFTLTTTGSSGAATYSGGTLNIPQYSGGSSGISGLTANFIPLAGSATTITANSHMDDGVTTAATITSTEALVAPSYTSNGTTGGIFAATQGTTPTIPANSVGFQAPGTVTTALSLRFPNANPSANQIMVFPAPTSNVSQWAWTGFTSTNLTDTAAIAYLANTETFTAPQTVQAVLANQTPTFSEQVASGDGTSGTNWTCAFTGTSFFSGGSNTAWSCQHTSGSTATLTDTVVSITSGSNYDIALTMTAGTTGNVTITAGGFTSGTFAAATSGTTHFGLLSSSTTSLTITPTTAFNGTFTISVGKVTAVSVPTLALTDSAAAISQEFRPTKSSLNNFFAGGQAGQNCTLGCNTDVAVGFGAGANIGSAVNDTYLGFDAGNQNSWASANTGIGSGALRLNISGTNNTGLGFNAGRFINDGATSNLAGTASTFVGAKAYPNIDSDTDETVVGALAIGSGSHTVTLGASTVTDIWMGNSTATPAASAKVHATDFVPSSSAPGVVTGSTCGSPTVVGNDHYGIITAGAVTTCTLKVTFSFSATNGWSCQFNDQTTAADTVHQHSNTVNSATTNAATIVSGDLINYTCGPF